MLTIENMSSKQSDMERLILGPSYAQAYGGDGAPTAAACGFARTHSVSAEDLEVRETAKGRYVSVVQREKGRETALLMPELAHAAITGINFSKSMRWPQSDMKFARPIRCLVCMLGRKIIRLRLNTLTGKSTTTGHLLLYPRRVKIADASQY